MKYRPVPCPCSYSRCPDWHVAPCADIPSVAFTKKQAMAVALLLNLMDERDHPVTDEHLDNLIKEMIDA